MRIVSYVTSKKIDDIDLFDTLILAQSGIVLTLPTDTTRYGTVNAWVIALGDITVHGTALAEHEMVLISSGWTVTKVSAQGLRLGTEADTAFRGDYGNYAYSHSQQPHADYAEAYFAYAHSQSEHAPTNAQKNSDITKGEIEAKLTGVITSHSHSGGGGTLTTWYEPMVVEGENGPEILFSEGDIVMVEVDV